MDNRWYFFFITSQVTLLQLCHVNAQIGEHVLGCTGQNVLLPCAKNFDISSISAGSRLSWNIVNSGNQILQYKTGDPTFSFSAGFQNTVKYNFSTSTYSLELKSAKISDSVNNYDCTILGGNSFIVDVTIIEISPSNLTLAEVKVGTEVVSNGSTMSASFGDSMQITAIVPLVVSSGTFVETPTITITYDGLAVSTCTKSSNSSHSLVTCSITVTKQQSTQICTTVSACTVNGTTHCFQINATSGTTTNPTVDTTPVDTTPVNPTIKACWCCFLALGVAVTKAVIYIVSAIYFWLRTPKDPTAAGELKLNCITSSKVDICESLSQTPTGKDRQTSGKATTTDLKTKEQKEKEEKGPKNASSDTGNENPERDTNKSKDKNVNNTGSQVLIDNKCGTFSHETSNSPTAKDTESVAINPIEEKSTDDKKKKKKSKKDKKKKTNKNEIESGVIDGNTNNNNNNCHTDNQQGTFHHMLFQVLLGLGLLFFAGMIALDIYCYKYCNEENIWIATCVLTAILAGLPFILMCVSYYMLWTAEQVLNQ